MHAPPGVSVIIIFFNAYKFFEQAIESVLAQTYASWELLLVDDGSTDSSSAIGRTYQDRYPSQVRYLEHAGHQNRGMSASRNLGIAQAAGELIAFLDADDIWFPDKLAKQVAIMHRYPDIGLLSNPALYWYPDGAKQAQRMTLPSGRLPRCAWVPLMLESDDNAACPSTVLMRKRLAVWLGGFEESFRGLFEDQAMWFKINLSSSIYHDPDYLILYRIHPDACTSATPPATQRQLRASLYSWLITYLCDPRHEQRPPRSIQVMARSKLCDALVSLARHNSGAVAGALPSGRRRSRFLASLKLAWTNVRLLGCFTALVVAGAFSARTATAVSRRAFRLANAAYLRRWFRRRDGFSGATRAAP